LGGRIELPLNSSLIAAGHRQLSNRLENFKAAPVKAQTGCMTGALVQP